MQRNDLRYTIRQILAGLILLLSSLWPAVMLAHGGGTPQLTRAEAGPYSVYAWTVPEPLRAEEVHVSIAVTVPAANAAGQALEIPVTDAEVEVSFAPVGRPEQAITVQASPQSDLGNLYYEADAVLPTDGEWQVTVGVTGPSGSGSARFSVQVLPVVGMNWSLVIGGGVLLLIIVGLMGMWTRLQANKKLPHGQPSHQS
jgi:hypothetical protein